MSASHTIQILQASKQLPMLHATQKMASEGMHTCSLEVISKRLNHNQEHRLIQQIILHSRSHTEPNRLPDRPPPIKAARAIFTIYHQ